MRVLMVSIDRGLLGQGQLGDVVQRHKKYGESVERLDIIVFSGKGFEPYKISKNVTAYPSNSCCGLKYFCDAKKIGKNLFKENKYDLVVTQEPFLTGLVGYCLKRKFKAKLLVHFHGDFWQNKNWLKEQKINWLFLLISKFVVSKADGIRVMSEGQKNKLINTGIKKEKIRVISTPVNLEKYDRPDLDKESTVKTVLHVGRDDKVKGYDILLKAFDLVDQKLSNVKFVKVLGGKEFSKAIDNHINKNLHITTYPQIDHEDLADFYYQADVVVLSSTSESFGKVLVEANACGKPVVSTATTGAKEIIKNGYNGYLVAIGDAQALADKILELLNNPIKAKTMGQKGRELMKEKFFDNTKKIIDLWNEVVNL